MRVQQTIRSQESSIVSYKIANLLQFYLMTMRRTVGDDALLSTTLKEYAFPFETKLCLQTFLLNYVSRITDMAYKLFYESIETQSHVLSRIPLVCAYPSLIIFYSFSLLRNRTKRIDRLNHPSSFSIMRKSSAK